MRLERKVSLFLIGLSILLLYNIKSLKFWSVHGPAEGFLPLFCTIILLICGIILTTKNNREKRKDQDGSEKKPIIYFALMFGSVILMEYIGYFFSFAIFCLGTLIVVQKYNFLKSLQIYLFLMVFIFIVFILWLRVPLPTGILWEGML
jgi:putative tricarboxylic transport membrane protein